MAKLFGIWERRDPEEKMGEGEVRSNSEIIKRKDTVSNYLHSAVNVMPFWSFILMPPIQSDAKSC